MVGRYKKYEICMKKKFCTVNLFELKKYAKVNVQTESKDRHWKRTIKTEVRSSWHSNNEKICNGMKNVYALYWTCFSESRKILWDGFSSNKQKETKIFPSRHSGSKTLKLFKKICYIIYDENNGTLLPIWNKYFVLKNRKNVIMVVLEIV